MDRSIVLKLLIGLLTAATVWWLGGTAAKLYHYWNLDRSVATTEIEWALVDAGSDQFLLQATYTYVADGTVYHASHQFDRPLYRNAWSARRGIEQRAQYPSVKVWISGRDPTQSSLQKSFPLKECISSGILMGLVLYFVGLGLYVRRLEERS